jgi:hypothetical protein
MKTCSTGFYDRILDTVTPGKLSCRRIAEDF